jgi:hypothetical protein
MFGDMTLKSTPTPAATAVDAAPVGS